MPPNPSLIQALKKLNPTLPPDDADYIERGWEVLERLELMLAAGETVRAVLHGPIGVGKSTELRHWARRLADVVNVLPVSANQPTIRLESKADVHAYITRSIGSALGRQTDMVRTEMVLGVIPHEVHVPPSRVDLKRILVDAGIIDSDDGKKSVILLDGLDLLPNEQTALFGAAQNLPLEVLPSVIFVASHPWCTLTPREQRDPRLEYIWELPCFPVQFPDGTRYTSVIDELSAGLYKRLIGAEEAFWDLTRCCEVAAYTSGGVPRDAIRILHSAVLSAAKSGKVNAANLSQGVNELRQDIAQSLSTDELQNMAKIAKSANHEGDLSLISKNAILPYNLGYRRYWLPHPVLRNLIGAPQVV